MTAPQDPFSTPSDGTPRWTPEEARRDQGYGAPPPYGAPAGFGRPARPRNGLGIAALVLGVLGLFSWFFLIGGLLGLVAIVLGVMGRSRAKRGEATNGGMALAGIITGLLALLLAVLVGVGIASLFGSESFSNLTECLQEAGGDQEAIQECSQQFEEQVGTG